jgi:hypothetical protein
MKRLPLPRHCSGPVTQLFGEICFYPPHQTPFLTVQSDRMVPHVQFMLQAHVQAPASPYLFPACASQFHACFPPSCLFSPPRRSVSQCISISAHDYEGSRRDIILHALQDGNLVTEEGWAQIP